MQEHTIDDHALHMLLPDHVSMAYAAIWCSTPAASITRVTYVLVHGVMTRLCMLRFMSQLKKAALLISIRRKLQGLPLRTNRSSISWSFMMRRSM